MDVATAYLEMSEANMISHKQIFTAGGEGCVGQAKMHVEGLKKWPEGSYWKPTSRLSEPVFDGDRVTWQWMTPDTFSDYWVEWSKITRKKNRS